MHSVQRLRELFSTLRFRLVVWITLVVFLMVLVTSITVREFVQRALRYEYDQSLEEILKEVQISIRKDYPNRKRALLSALENKVQAHQHRVLFVHLYDARQQLIWSSDGVPAPSPPAQLPEKAVPFDEDKYRILEAKGIASNGEIILIRCGFFQVTLEEDIILLNRIMLLVSFSILLAAPVGGYVIALRATNPIARIIATTAKLQPTNMNERLPIRGTGDELDQLSQTINGMLDRLASFIDHNRDFVANAAHELRSPLAAIRSSVEVALNRSRTPEEYTVLLTDVIEEIGRLAGLVNRLLILAEGDAGRLSGQDQRTHLDKIVRESADMFDAVAESLGVRLIVDDLAPAVVSGDETYLRQVVRNLIDNAIKYNKTGGEIHLALTIDPKGEQALFTVRDTGVGIDREVLPRIFDRFYRADKSRRREKERGGHGLGLSICQTIVQALHGEIGVESIAGRGSTFTVRLPLAPSTG